MNAQIDTMMETQAQILDEIRNGYAPRASPMTAKDLLQASGGKGRPVQWHWQT
jgi:hypothetical protein